MRDFQNGMESDRIRRHEKRRMSIFSLACSPKRDDDLEVIAVVDQNQSLAFYDTSGKQVIAVNCSSELLTVLSIH